MSQLRKRHHNDGLRKICGCGRRNWSKCPHDWHFNFTWRKTPYRFSLDRHLGRKLTGKTEAETAAENLRITIRAGKFGDQQPQVAALTLRQLVTLYGERTQKVREQDSVEVLFATVLPRPAGGELVFGDWPVADITTDTVERFREVRSVRRTVVRPGEWKPRIAGGVVAANRHLSFLRASFNWAIRMGYLERTPFKRGTEAVVKMTPEMKRRRRLEPGEYERLVGACAPHVRLIVEAALETACRVGELLSLQWMQVRQTPHPHLFLPAAKTKTKRDRTVHVSPRLQAILEILRTDAAGAARSPDAYVFGNLLGQRYESIDHAFIGACQRAGIAGLHFHDLRREAASRWLEGGLPLNAIQALLGHTTLSQTSTYLGIDQAGTYEALRKFWAASQIASPTRNELARNCIAGRNNAPQSASIGSTVGQETTINIERNRSDNDRIGTENRSVDGSIPPLATINFFPVTDFAIRS